MPARVDGRRLSRYDGGRRPRLLALLTLYRQPRVRRLLNLALMASLLCCWVVVPPYRSSAADHDPPLALDSAPFGINTHLATRATDQASLDVPADMVVRAGAGWAREDIHWYRIQPTPTTWDWEFTDAALRALVLRGVKVVGVIGHPPGWATPTPYDSPGGFSFYPPDPDRFAAFAQAVAVRYSKYIKHWEIWNEPDNPAFWRPAPDPQAYARLLMQTSAAIRSAVPDAQILIGGTNPFDTHFLRAVAEAGAWPSIDIVAIHPYIEPAAPESGNIAAAADGVRAIGQAYGERPIWVTEVGWASRASAREPGVSLDEQTQAAYLTRATLLLWRAGVERIFWYTLKDDPEGDTFGMFALGAGRSDFSRPKPAYFAFQTLSRQLASTQYTAIRDLFQSAPALDFEQFGVWVRGDQPYGRLTSTSAFQHSGQASAQLSYSFPTRGNDYVVFRRSPAAPLPGSPSAVGVWVYGDGSGNLLKLWLRDAEGEVLQYSLGPVGPARWRFMQASVAEPVPSWDRISGQGNGRLDAPARVEAVVLDDAPDSFVGSGTIYLDDLAAISGTEAYDLRVRGADGATVDVLWAPRPVLVSLASRGPSAVVTELDGRQRAVAVTDARVVIPIGPAPVFVRHGGG